MSDKCMAQFMSDVTAEIQRLAAERDELRALVAGMAEFIRNTGGCPMYGKMGDREAAWVERADQLLSHHAAKCEVKRVQWLEKVAKAAREVIKAQKRYALSWEVGIDIDVEEAFDTLEDAVLVLEKLLQKVGVNIE